MRYLLSVCFILCGIYLYAVNVSGNVMYNTVWSPENNPYVVTGFLFVDAGVTLTILPGVEVKVYDADGSSNGANFDYHNGLEPLAKAIVVYGTITAIGTAEQPISFDNYSGDHYRRWGGIAIMEDAPRSTFRYCNLSHQYAVSIGSKRSLGALTFFNGLVDVRNCKFYDVLYGIESNYLAEPALIYGCDFRVEHVIPNSFECSGCVLGAVNSFPDGLVDVWVQNCTFSGIISIGGGSNTNRYLINNKAKNLMYIPEQGRPFLNGSIYTYGNYFENARGTGAYAPAVSDTAYCRRNTIIQTQPTAHNIPIPISGRGDGTVFVADNYAYGNVQLYMASPEAPFRGYFYNNKIVTSGRQAIEMDGDITVEELFDIHIFNNVIVGLPGNTATFNSSTSGYANYNTLYGSDRIFGSAWYTPYLIKNNVFAKIDIFSDDDLVPYYSPLFSYNALSCPILFPRLDGGGNIYTDPMLADTLSYDFHLLAGSPCIDAGIVTEDQPAFDADYHLRVAGNAPDMGAYEYGSVYMGGIQGYVYNAETNEPIDCAQIRIAGKLPEFSDSLGCFPYPTGAGVYTVTVKRFDFAETVIPNVVVTVGDTTWLNIPLQTTVATNEQITPELSSSLALSNYPNPFRQTTGINFILPEKAAVELTVYNLKGQKVARIAATPLSKGHHSFAWDGKDEAGKACSSGIYLLKLTLDGKAASSRKVTLVK